MSNDERHSGTCGMVFFTFLSFESTTSYSLIQDFANNLAGSSGQATSSASGMARGLRGVAFVAENSEQSSGASVTEGEGEAKQKWNPPKKTANPKRSAQAKKQDSAAHRPASVFEAKRGEKQRMYSRRL